MHHNPDFIKFPEYVAESGEHDWTYLRLVRKILEEGEIKPDRTGTGVQSIFGHQSVYDLEQGFPLLTTKKVLFSGVVHELLWFLKGSTNIYDGLSQHTPIWDAWANSDGDLGPIYGHQWRSWGAPPYPGFDQITNVIDQIDRTPDSRRMIVSAWNVEDIPEMALPPCHVLFQFYVREGSKLDLQLYQRSADVALGVPFNIASYSLLLAMVANETGYTPGRFIHTIGDAHIYLNHIEGLKEQLKRGPYRPPSIALAKKKVLEMTYEDIELVGYQHHPFIKFTVAV